MEYRFYLSDLAVFISVDPKRRVPNANRSPRLLNAYAYGNANPLSNIDPLGLEAKEFGNEASATALSDGTVGIEREVYLYRKTYGPKRANVELTALTGEARFAVSRKGVQIAGGGAIVKGELSVEPIEGVSAKAHFGLGAEAEASFKNSKLKIKAWALVGAEVEIDLSGTTLKPMVEKQRRELLESRLRWHEVTSKFEAIKRETEADYREAEAARRRIEAARNADQVHRNREALFQQSFPEPEPDWSY
jgi:hypothetical protein